jgi:hypothetical protein
LIAGHSREGLELLPVLEANPLVMIVKTPLVVIVERDIIHLHPRFMNAPRAKRDPIAGFEICCRGGSRSRGARHDAA